MDVAELRKAMPKLGLSMSEEQLQALLPGADRDRKVDVLTFIQSLAPRYSGDPVPPEVREVLTAIETTFATGCKTLLDMFLRFDSNKNGILELNEIQQMMVCGARRLVREGSRVFTSRGGGGGVDRAPQTCGWGGGGSGKGIN